jgi:peptide/nickel transport system permease protein/peptide/nickel transport system substrate-binding protein
MISPTAAGAGADVGTNPVGTGPYTFVEFVPDDHLTVSKNADYWRAGKPYLDTITFRFIGDAQTSSSALQAGDVDAILKVNTADVEALEGVDGVQVVSHPSLLTDGCYFNYSRPPFDDVKVRQAFAIAIDRDVLNDLYAFGQAIPTSQIFPTGYWASDPSRADTFVYDPDQAKALLAEAGYPDGLSIKSITFDASGEIRKMEILQAQLKEVGIDMTFDVKDAAAVAGAFFEDMSYDTACASWSGRPDPSQTASALYGSTSFYNAGKYASPGMDEALAAAVASQDQADRAAAFSTVIELSQDDALWMPFLHEPDITALSDDIEGLVPNLYGKVDVSFLWLNS